MRTLQRSLGPLLIIALFLVAVSLCAFLRENAFLEDQTVQRILTFASAQGYAPVRDTTYGSVVFMEKRDYDGYILMISYDYVGSEVVVIRVPRGAGMSVTADPDSTHSQDFIAMWHEFDRHQHPISHEVIADVLWCNLKTHQEWARRFAVHHFGLPYQALYGLAHLGLRALLPAVGLQGVFFLCRWWLLVLIPAVVLISWEWVRRRSQKLI